MPCSRDFSCNWYTVKVMFVVVISALKPHWVQSTEEHAIFVAVQTVTFVLVERGDGGARMSCETAPSFQQRESSSWRGSRRAHLPDLITSLLSFQELCCLRERLRLCKALQWWVQCQACPRLGGSIKGSVGNKSLRQIEFRVVFHPSAHLFLGICNGSLLFVVRGLVFFSKIPKCDCFMT